jgi:hydroxymethylpyrimidine kinase/phosphomethylpyrimidine kinase/thiamine-phosphate diphosphorylase
VSPRPIIWSIAGLDTAGGAGLSADQRAADALGVHLCPVAAALTAQHSQGVEAVFPVPEAQLEAQLQALAEDLPPVAIKTGLLGSVAAVQAVARWVDHFRARTPAGQDPHRQLALIVDPVLGASAGGSAFASASVLQACCEWLLPRATVLTPNRAEAQRLLGLPADGPHPHGGEAVDTDLPALARRLQALGARSVVITGGDAPSAPGADGRRPHCLDWLQTPHAQGWLTAPRVDTPHHHGTGCTFATGVAAAWVLGHVEADAIVLANLLTRHALMQAHGAGRGPGPVKARPGFDAGPQAGGAPMPWLGLGEALPWALEPRFTAFAPFAQPADRLYGILPDAPQLRGALGAGLRCVQLRHKAREGLMPHLRDSIDAAAQAGAQLFVNDHWREALALPPKVDAAPTYRLGLHLGQEDLLALGPADQALLQAEAGRMMLGLSSHSLWELARALGCCASYVACGPVQATTTKDMPWRPQGERNLRWWVAQSPVPVVAIGGLLTPEDLARFSACGPAALCVVRGLGSNPADMPERVAAMRAALTPPAERIAIATGPQPVLPL